MESASPPGRESWVVARGLIPEKGTRRTLASATFINMIGNGMFMTAAALFYTRSIGLPLASVGLGLTVATLIGLVAGVPVGHLADRRGPRETYLGTLVVQAAAMAALVLVHSFTVFLLIIIVIQLANSSSQASRGPLLRSFAGPRPAQFRSYLRALNNAAGALGGVVAGVVVELNTRPAYVAAVLFNAVTFLACAALVMRLPTLPPAPASREAKSWTALRDIPYVTVGLLDGIMWIQGQVLVFALPLWIVGHTSAPRWLVGASVVINTGMVVLFQVRASRGIEDNAGAVRAMRRAGFAFLAGMTVIAVVEHAPAWVAVVGILAGVAVHTVGELWHAGASFEFSFGLAPAHAQGQYSGVYALGRGLANAAAPSVLAVLCIEWGMPGWLLMGAVFVLIGLSMPMLARWADRTRPADPADPAGAVAATAP